MFNPKAYENSRPDGIAVLEIVGNGRAAAERPLFVPLKRTELAGEITGPLAALRLTQTYGYSKEQCDKTLEAVYRFPLPGDAAVTAVAVRFGDVEIRAELKERAGAEADYAQARREGRQAALATRESPDVFTLQVAGLRPDQEVRVETSYVQLAGAEGAGWSLRVPLTTSPRYLRSDELTSRHAQGQPLALLRDPGHRFALDLVVREAAAVQSPTHPLDVAQAGDDARVRLQGGDVLPDRDCVLTWQPRQAADRPRLGVLLHHDEAAGQVYFLAQVAPPASEPRTAVPREIVLLVDHSGSMEGPKWRAADWAVKRFLSELTPADALGLGLFHNLTYWFSDQLQPADPATVQKAAEFLQAHRDSGGTELGVALEQALRLGRGTGDFARHTLIMTDAEVTDAGRILRLAGEESRRADRRRISVLCIDAAPNSFLATELARRGGGVARFLTSDPAEGDISTALDRLLADWAQPVLAGLRLEISRPAAEAAGRDAGAAEQAGWSAIDLGDLPMGRSVWVAGRVPRGESPDLLFRLSARGRPGVADLAIDLAHAESRRPALKALFGAQRVLGLEFLISSGHTGADLAEQLESLGYDPRQALAGPGKPSAVYAENVRADAHQALRGLLAREALDFGLASSETAFIAVRTEKGQPVEGTVAVANALPSGWSESFLSGSPAAFGAAKMARMAMPSPPPAASAPRAMGFADDTDMLCMDICAAPSPPPSPGRHAAWAAAPPQPQAVTVFSGVPEFKGGEAVLFDSAHPVAPKRSPLGALLNALRGGRAPAGTLPERAVITALRLAFAGGPPKASDLDPGLRLLLFVGDLASPRAEVRLADLVRQGLERPLHILRAPGEEVRVVLLDPAGAWSRSAPSIELAFALQP